MKASSGAFLGCYILGPKTVCNKIESKDISNAEMWLMQSMTLQGVVQTVMCRIQPLVDILPVLVGESRKVDLGQIIKGFGD